MDSLLVILLLKATKGVFKLVMKQSHFNTDAFILN